MRCAVGKLGEVALNRRIASPMDDGHDCLKGRSDKDGLIVAPLFASLIVVRRRSVGQDIHRISSN